MPLRCAEYWDAKAAQAARRAQDIKTTAAKASMLLIALNTECSPGAALQLLHHCLNFHRDTGIIDDTESELAHPRRFGA